MLAYLLKCDLALYVISSRVGLRQADFQFLQELRRMGLGEHLIFVLNLDLADHKDAADCEVLTARVRRELAPWVPEPKLCAFSALQVLLERRRETGVLASHEEALLSLWQADPGKTEMSRRGWEEFRALFLRTVEEVRARRQAGGALPQVLMVARGLAEQVEWARRLLDQDAGAYRELAAKLTARRQPSRRSGPACTRPWRVPPAIWGRSSNTGWMPFFMSRAAGRPPEQFCAQL